MMWRLARIEAERIRAATRINVEVREPIVALCGRSRAGKTSTLQAIIAALTGRAVGPRGTLAQDDLRNPAWGNGWAAVTFRNDTGEEFAVERYFAKSVGVAINGVRTKTIGEATDRITESLGATPEQLMGLATADDLLFARPLDQARVLCDVLGLDIVFDRDPVVDEDGAETVSAGLVQRLNGHAQLGRAVLSPIARESGWSLLARAQEVAEDARTDAGRELKRAKAAVEGAEAALQGALQAARVPDASALESKRSQALRAVAEADERVSTLSQARRQRADAINRREVAARALERAEADVRAARARIEEAAARRDEVTARRTELGAQAQAMRANVEVLVKLALAAEQLAEARDREQRDLAARFSAPPATYACPHCGGSAGFVNGALVEEAKLPASEVSEEELAEAAAAREKAQEAFRAADSTLVEARRTLRQVESDLAALPTLDSPELLEERLNDAVTASDAASEALEAAKALPLPAEVTEQEVAAAQGVSERARALISDLDGAAASVAAHGAAAEAAQAADATHKALDALVDRLREMVREIAGEMAAPIAESLSVMLERPVVFDPEVGLGAEISLAGDDMVVRPLAQGSTGERLQASAALQGVMAARLGVGMALVDEFSGLDPEWAKRSIEVMREVSERTGVVWVLTTAQDLPGYGTRADEQPLPGVQVVMLDGGYSDESAAPVAAEAALSAK